MILEAKNILYSYKSKRDKNVLNNVSATFEECKFCSNGTPILKSSVHSF